MHFKIDSTNNAGPGDRQIVVFMSYSAETKKSTGENRTVTASRRGKFEILMRRLVGIEDIQELRRTR